MARVIDLLGRESARRAGDAFRGFAERMTAGVDGFDDLRQPVTDEMIVVFETDVFRSDPSPGLARWRVCVGHKAPLNCWGDGGEHDSPASALEAFVEWANGAMDRASIALFLLLAVPSAVRAEGAQLRASFSAGVTSAGAYSGGITLLPSLTYAVRPLEHVEFSLSNVPMVTGMGYHNLGVVDHTLLGAGGYWASGYVRGALSADVFNTILCGRICNRVVGVTPGFEIGGSYFGWLGDRLGLIGSVHLSWVVSGAVYSGPIWTISAGPTVRLGGVRGGI